MLLLTALILSSCGGSPTPTEALPRAAATDEPVMTEVPMSSPAIPTETATVAPTEAPTETPEKSGTKNQRQNAANLLLADLRRKR